MYDQRLTGAQANRIINTLIDLYEDQHGVKLKILDAVPIGETVKEEGFTIKDYTVERSGKYA